VSLRPRYLLDTNICIYLMKHQPPQVAERISACRVGEVLISAITAAELEYGVVASGADALKELLSTLDLNGVLIQADALHTSPSFFSSQQNRGPTCS
jgi:tRNA(fMet)-specific endonuclease VapC